MGNESPGNKRLPAQWRKIHIRDFRFDWQDWVLPQYRNIVAQTSSLLGLYHEDGRLILIASELLYQITNFQVCLSPSRHLSCSEMNLLLVWECTL